MFEALLESISFYLRVPSSVTIPRPSALFCLSNAFKSRTLIFEEKTNSRNRKKDYNIQWKIISFYKISGGFQQLLLTQYDMHCIIFYLILILNKLALDETKGPVSNSENK